MNVTIMNRAVITEIQTRFSDFDPLQHLNNSRYLDYIEIARVEAFTKVLGIDLRKVVGVVRQSKVNYKAPISYGTPLVVTTEVTDVGDSSITLSFKVANKRDHSRVYATVDMVQVTWSVTEQKPIPVPDLLRDNIDRLNSGELDMNLDEQSEMKVA